MKIVHTRQTGCNVTTKPANRARTARGFSVVELVVVLAIILVLSSIAIPSLLSSMRTYRISSAASSLSALLQRARFEAIRRNTPISVRTKVDVTGDTVVYIDLNGNSRLDPDEPQIMQTSDIQFMAAGGSVPAPASTGYPAAVSPPGIITFGVRGTVNYTGAQTDYISYLGNPAGPNLFYSAVTVSQMGQIKAWTAPAGGSWSMR
jgi:prepilin-type N-terminal cleavage/methylation domain-containing protein